MSPRSEDCSERQQLLNEFTAWNELLAKIHEAEIEALLIEDLAAFQSLQSMAQKAYETRETIANALVRDLAAGITPRSISVVDP